jgi:16S rRNA (adenine1518-N6/adenine1519-N6)-dimethyltransferase
MMPSPEPQPAPEAEAPQRQTLSYLRGLLEARGLRPNPKLGQSLLIDLNLLDLMVRTAAVGPEDLVLEVGSGTGSLTAKLAAQAGAVLGVEIDPGFYALACEHTREYPNTKILLLDILQNKNTIQPEVINTLKAKLAPGKVTRLKMVANLPYVVATPVISNFLLTDLPFDSMVVMVQLELAERMTAAPGCKDFNSLTVMIQSLADARIIRRLPPQAFWPRPQVESAILEIRPNAAKRAKIPDLAVFHRFVHNLYLHRRKNLRGALWPYYGQTFSRPELDALLERHGFHPGGRAEALTVEQHLALSQALAGVPLAQ